MRWAGAQQVIARTVDLNYATGRTRETWYSLEGRLFFERDPTDRFYGIGNDSRLGGQSNYTTEQVYVRAKFGWNITQALQLGLVTRPRYFRLLKGAFTTIPQTSTFYPRVKGVGAAARYGLKHGQPTIPVIRSTSTRRHPGRGLRRYRPEGAPEFVSYNRVGVDLHRYWTLTRG